MPARPPSHAEPWSTRCTFRDTVPETRVTGARSRRLPATHQRLTGDARAAPPAQPVRRSARPGLSRWGQHDGTPNRRGPAPAARGWRYQRCRGRAHRQRGAGRFPRGGGPAAGRLDRASSRPSHGRRGRRRVPAVRGEARDMHRPRRRGRPRGDDRPGAGDAAAAGAGGPPARRPHAGRHGRAAGWRPWLASGVLVALAAGAARGALFWGRRVLELRAPEQDERDGVAVARPVRPARPGRIG